MSAVDRTTLHEHLTADDEPVEASPRSFGWVFATVFTIVAVGPLWRGRPVRIWALAVAAAFLITTLVRPAALRPLSRIWQRVGLLLHHIVNPIVMGVLFYLAITPFGFIMRLCGKGLARQLSPDRSATTYWISRDGSPASDMTHQF